MNDEKIDEIYNEKLFNWLNKDINAYNFCQGILYVAHLWDDLIDKDKTRTDYEINLAFRFMTSDMITNPFYQKFMTELAPLISNSALQFHCINILEAGSLGEKHMAFMLRNSLLSVIAYCFYLLGGAEKYEEVATDFYKYLGKNMHIQLSDFLQEDQSCQIQ